MHSTLVYIEVKDEYIEDFIRATAANHAASIKEPGNLRFDVLQQDDDPQQFILYEIYTDEQASIAHKQTPHYMTWRDSVADWMASPRRGVLHKALYPQSTHQWKTGQ